MKKKRLSRSESCVYCGGALIGRGHVQAILCRPCSILVAKLSQRANHAVRKAIIDGDLINPKRLQCVDCGDQAKFYDHRDYSKPLDVEPVCHGCNIRRGPANADRNGA